MKADFTRDTDIVGELNRLMVINMDRANEYRLAISATQDPALKSVFKRYYSQSCHFAQTLMIWVSSYSGKSAKATLKRSWFARFAARLRALLPRPQRDEIINACEYREAISISIYKNVLALHRLPYEAFLEVKRQKEHIEKAFLEIIALSSPTTFTY